MADTAEVFAQPLSKRCKRDVVSTNETVTAATVTIQHDACATSAECENIPALERLLVEIGGRKQTANIAHVRAKTIRHDKETFTQKVRRTVCNHAVALHLTETKTWKIEGQRRNARMWAQNDKRNETSKPRAAMKHTTTARSSLGRLPNEVLQRSARTRVNLVVDQMLETLIVRRPKVNQLLELAARVTARGESICV